MTNEFVVSLGIRVTILALAGALIIASRRKANASERHLIWLLTLSSMILLPIATVQLPAIPVITIPGGVVERLPSVQQLGGSPETAGPLQAPSRVVISLIWIVGTVVGLGRLLLAHGRAQRIVSLAVYSDVLSRKAGSPVHISDAVAFTFSYGLRNPVIVLPAEAARWPEVELHATLLHEGAHVSRRDGLSLVISEFVVALYWWHPVVWVVARLAAAERERACDDAVVRAGVRPSEYGSHLLRNATSRLSTPRPVAAALLSHSDGLASRVSRLLDAGVDRGVVSGRRAVLVSACAVPALALVASASPVVQRLPEAILMQSLAAVHVIAQQPTTKPSITTAPVPRARSAAPVKTRQKEMSAGGEEQPWSTPDDIVPPLASVVKDMPQLAKRMGLVAARMGKLASQIADTTRKSPW